MKSVHAQGRAQADVRTTPVRSDAGGSASSRPGTIPLVLTLVAAAVLGAAALATTIGATRQTSTVHADPEQPATATDIGIGPANNSPELVQDPTDKRFIVLVNRLDAPDFSCAMEVSGDGGRTWAPAAGAPALPGGTDKCYAPEAAFDRKGRLYLLFVGLVGKGNHPMGAFLTSSIDRGRTFAPPEQILGPENFGVRMTIDRDLGASGRMHIVWLHAAGGTTLGGFGAAPNPILSAFSDDGGKHFSAPVQVSDVGAHRVVAPALALGPHHTVDVAYYDLQDDARDYEGLEGPTWDGKWSIVNAVSKDAGRTFGHGRVVDDSVVAPGRVMLIYTMPPPSMAVTQSGRACLAWTDARLGDADAMLRCSDPEANVPSPLVRLNDDRIGDGSTQALPRLAVSPNGRIDAIFLDRRDDPQNAHNDVWYASSVDGGRRFSRNFRLTSASSDARIGQQYAGVAADGQVELGSRLGLLSERHQFVAAWPDTRNSRFSSVEQDIFVRGGSVRSRRSLFGLLVGLLLFVAAGLLVLSATVRHRQRVR